MFEEVRSLHRAYPGLRPETILRMATINGARALGKQGLAGQLSEGSYADLVAIPWSGTDADFMAHLVNDAPKPAGVMIGGIWVEGDLRRTHPPTSDTPDADPPGAIHPSQ
jgi:imidazolonepropionase-like amidohydrolase